MGAERIIPFVHSFDEYTLMFSLDVGTERAGILSVVDGPASFNAEAAEDSWMVTSLDPLYQAVGSGSVFTHKVLS